MNLPQRLTWRSLFVLPFALLLTPPAPADGPSRAPAPAGKVDYNRDVRPILSDACFACHGPDAKKRKGGLRLDVRDKSKEDGKLLVPGKPDQSELFRRITSDDAKKRMPPAKSGKSLTAAQIALLKRWVEEGAHHAEHWAYVAPTRPPVPAVKNAALSSNPIDRFILARLEQEGLNPSPEADRVTLIRRVTLDLTGLPPTPEGVQAFLDDARPGAYERLVDRLLASPRYGEHMGRFWLDLARFGDTHGLHLDNYREMWPYRDWVVRAFNANKPYDRFVTEQLAGDLLPGRELDNLIATGFNRAHVTTSEGGSITEEVHIRNVNDRVETTGTVFLGLTVGCARCHDHKYDPVSQKDFYSLSAFFNSLDGNPLDGNAARHPPVVQMKATPRQKQELAALVRKAADLRLQTRRVMSPPPWSFTDHEELTALWPRVAALYRQYRRLDAQIGHTYVYREAAKPRQAYLLKRGEYDQRGAPVERDVPAFLPSWPDKGKKDRLGLARWLLSEKQPLTARVAVNRYWQQVFGTGLVKTAEDLGIQGEPPSHPELLDWLAVEFRETGWDVKGLMRLLVTSATYRQSSRLTKDRLAKDPANRLLSRGPRFRLDAEMLRDQALAVSGLLVERQGGPSVKPPQPPGIWEAVGYSGSNTVRFTADTGIEKVHRRSLYTFWKRTAPPPQMSTFDAPSRESCTVRRERTNTPLQALLLLNDPQYVESARALAQMALMKGGKTDEERIAFLFRRATCRAPASDERAVLLGALAELREEYGKDEAAAKKLVSVGETKPAAGLDAKELAAWAMLASTVLNLDEVLNKG
jgi:mono/diheme cytochrome c family protein